MGLHLDAFLAAWEAELVLEYRGALYEVRILETLTAQCATEGTFRC